MPIESRINDALRQLGEEHRLGMIKPEEFRGRRRALLESWGEPESTTSPGGRSLSITQTNPAMAMPRGNVPALAPARSRTAMGIAAGAALLAVVAVLAFWYWKQPAAPDVTRAVAVEAPRSPQLLAVMREATAFRNRNRWDAAEIEAFLAAWRTLPLADRQRAQQEPSLQSLRHELDENIRAERQALEMNPDVDGQARLDRLTEFASELTEDGS